MPSTKLTVSLTYETDDGEERGIEATVIYTPARPAPRCSDPDSPAFSDPGDPAEMEIVGAVCTDGEEPVPVGPSILEDERFYNAVFEAVESGEGL